jgi:phage-related minor tail protein
MAARTDLELALRIKTDLEEGRRALQNLTGDIEAVGESSAETSQQLNQVGAAAEAAGRGVSGSAAAQQQAAQSGAALVAALREQIDLFGKSADDVTRYRAAQAGVSEAVEPLIAQLRQLRDAQDAVNRASAEEAAVLASVNQARESRSGAQYAFLEGMREQVALFGKSGVELAEYEAKMLGVADSARPLIEQLRQLQAAQSQAEQAAREEAAAQQQAAAAKAQAAASQQSFLVSLREQVELQGKSATEVLEYRAAQLGVSNESAAYITKIRSFNEEQSRANELMHRGGLTAGQYQQALRMLPMQMTDVVTSVASGMPIWMIAIQQGGQIRDSFGGVGNAARAVVGSINPLTAAIAAVTAVGIGLVVAFQQGSNEAVAYRENLILTGNAAGTTSDQLAAMAGRIDEVSGTQRQAAAALAEVAGSGRFTASQIELVGTAAVSMENAVGKSVSSTVAEFIKLADQPSKAAAKLNEQYHFLTASVYEQIRALEDQGDTVGAANLAIEAYGQATVQRAAEITENLGSLESAWKGVANFAAEAWDAMLDIGREATLDERIAELEERIRNAQSQPRRPGNRVHPLMPTDDPAALQAERDRLKLQKEYENGVARQQGMLATANQEAIKAQDEIDKIRERSLDKAAKKEREIADYRANVERIRLVNPGSAAITDDQVAKDIAAIEKKYAERQRKATMTPEQRLAKQNAEWVAQLEKEAATYNQGQAARRQYELDQRGLTGTLRERAEAALKVLDASEKQKKADAQAAKDAKLLAQLNLDYLKATGQNIEAAGAEIEKKYGALQKRLEASGNTEGASLVGKLMGIEQAKAELDDLEQAIDRIFSEQSRREQSINTQQQAGLLSELGARQQILDLNKSTADQVEKLLPQMKELANATGDPASIERVKDLEARLGNLRTVAGDLSNALKSGFETGIQSALEGLATGTMDLQEAAISFVRAIGSSLADLASQQLAQLATDKLFSSGTDAASGAAAGAAQATAITTASTTGAATMGTSITSATAAGASLLSGSLTAAFSAGAGVIAAAIATASAGSGAAGGAGNLLAAIAGGSGGGAGAAGGAAGFTGAFGFADGGHVRGPGTTTSDSIRANLSDWEFVTRAAVVQQPGALDFLHEFNARGMAALANWAPRVHHATGGLAGVPAPALPAPTLGGARLAEPAAAMSTTLKNQVNLYAVQDAAQVASMAWSKPGQEHFMVFLQQNGSTIKQALGIG